MRRAFRLRLRILSIGIFFLALLLILRLYFVQVVDGKDYALAAEHQYVSSSESLFSRGSIYFTRKDGTLISAATLSTGFTIAINPSLLSKTEEAFTLISSQVPTIDRDAFFAAASKEKDPYEIIAKEVSDEAGRAIDAGDIPGIIVERQRWRSYPAGNEAAQSIGIIAYDNDNTIAGRFGLERYYNDTLVKDGDGLFGNFFAELFANLDSIVVDARSARQGDVVTSIEPVVQEKLTKVLAQISAEYGSQETGGIIMDPATGEIIALDVNPSFDPNNFKNENSNHFGNPLVESRYEFGSIFKTLTMAGGLDSGVVTPTTTYNDTGCMTVNKKPFCNYDKKARGVVPMQEILSQSLNVGAAFIATKTGHDRFRSYFTKLGLGTETGIDLPSEISGDIHNLTSSRDIEYITASYGQGIATTPVETIRALGALANHGAIVTPHLAKSIRLESGVTRSLTWGKSEQVYSPESVAAVSKMLVEVVDVKLGNGKVKIPEMSVAAKTGTAQMAGSGGTYSEDLYFHSFFGYFPAYEPKFIILLYTRQPQNVQYASETLTNPFMELTHFLINYYDIPPDRATYEAPH